MDESNEIKVGKISMLIISFDNKNGISGQVWISVRTIISEKIFSYRIKLS
jgi:hypothetical protein